MKNPTNVKVSKNDIIEQIGNALANDLIGTCEKMEDSICIHLLTGQRFAISVKELSDSCGE